MEFERRTFQANKLGKLRERARSGGGRRGREGADLLRGLSCFFSNYIFKKIFRKIHFELWNKLKK